MSGEIVAFFLLLLFGCGAFVLGVLCLIGKLLAAMARGLGRLFRVLCGSSWAMPFAAGMCDPASRAGGIGNPRVCPRHECRKVEYRAALFCSQCGHPLSDDARGAPRTGV